LQTLAFEIAERAILIGRARFAKVAQELYDRAHVHVAQATCGTHGIALGQAPGDLSAFLVG
jgi:hypothetical protein